MSRLRHHNSENHGGTPENYGGPERGLARAEEGRSVAAIWVSSALYAS